MSAVTQWREKVPPDRMLEIRALSEGDVTLEEMLAPAASAPPAPPTQPEPSHAAG